MLTLISIQTEKDSGVVWCVFSHRPGFSVAEKGEEKHTRQ